MNAASYVGDVPGGKVETALGIRHLAFSHYGAVLASFRLAQTIVEGPGGLK
jgi:hypothetical protein